MSWRAAAASVAGRRHLKTGTPCQDASATRTHAAGVTVVVCDGAGSAPASHIGATAVADAVAACIAERPREVDTLGRDALEAARAAIAGAAAKHSVAIEALACTLVVAHVVDHTLHVVHLGDGAVLAIDDGQARLVSRPDNAEFANRTWFVTSPDAAERLRHETHVLADTVSTIALLSDGAADGLVRGARVSQVIVQFGDWFDQTDDDAAVRDALEHALAESLRRTTGDDITVALAHRATTTNAPLVCPTCRRRDFRVAHGRSRHLVVACVGCGERTTMSAARTGWPEPWRMVVAAMAERHGVRIAARRSGLGRRLVARWVRGEQ